MDLLFRWGPDFLPPANLMSYIVNSLCGLEIGGSGYDRVRRRYACPIASCEASNSIPPKAAALSSKCSLPFMDVNFDCSSVQKYFSLKEDVPE